MAHAGDQGDAMTPATLIDLDRSPPDRPEHPDLEAVIARARTDPARGGMFDLPGFRRAEGIAAAVAETLPRIAAAAFTHRRRHTIYFCREVPGLDAGHPALREFETVNRTLGADRLAGGVRGAVGGGRRISALRALSCASAGQARALGHGRPARPHHRHGLPGGRGTQLAFRSLGNHHHTSPPGAGGRRCVRIPPRSQDRG
jgi:hypothetical protein